MDELSAHFTTCLMACDSHPIWPIIRHVSTFLNLRIYSVVISDAAAAWSCKNKTQVVVQFLFITTSQPTCIKNNLEILTKVPLTGFLWAFQPHVMVFLNGAMMEFHVTKVPFPGQMVVTLSAEEDSEMWLKLVSRPWVKQFFSSDDCVPGQERTSMFSWIQILWLFVIFCPVTSIVTF